MSVVLKSNSFNYQAKSAVAAKLSESPSSIRNAYGSAVIRQKTNNLESISTPRPDSSSIAVVYSRTIQSAKAAYPVLTAAPGVGNASTAAEGTVKSAVLYKNNSTSTKTSSQNQGIYNASGKVTDLKSSPSIVITVNQNNSATQKVTGLNINNPPVENQQQKQYYIESGDKLKPVISKEEEPKTIDFTLKPFKSPGNVYSVETGLANVVNYVEKYQLDDFDVKKSGNYAIIKGAGTSTALEQGIKGTRYAAKNAENYTNVFKYIEPKIAVKEALDLKSSTGKIGWAGVALDAGYDTYNNIKNNESVSKTVADAVVDAAFGAGSIAASAAAGAFAGAAAGAAIGSVVPIAGTVVGAAVGLAIGVGYTIATEGIIYKGKSAKDWAKEGVKTAVEWTAQQVGNAVQSSGKAIQAIAQNVNSTANTVGKAVQAAGTAANKAIQSSEKTVNNTVQAVSKAVQAAGNTVNKAAQATAAAVSSVTGSVGNAVQATGNAVNKTVQSAGSTASKGIQSVAGSLSKAVSPISGTASKAIQAAGNTVDKAVQAAASSVGKAVQSTSSAASNAIQAAGKAVSGAASSVGKAVQSAGSAVNKAVQSTGKAVSSTASSIGQAVQSAGTAASKAVQSAGKAVSNAASSVGKAVQSLGKSIGKLFGK